MFDIVVNVEGLERVVDGMTRLPDVVDQGVVDALTRTDLSIVARVKRSFPTGEIGTPRPQGMPGPPRRLTGNLSRSVVEVPVSGSPGAREGGVGVLATAPYGEPLELGGQFNVPETIRHSLRGAPRAIVVRAHTVDQPAYPYLGPGVDEEGPSIPETFRAAIQAAVDAAAGAA